MNETSEQMLSLCLDAFIALGRDASACRRFLKKDLGIIPGAYAGSGQSLVAREMIKRLSAHLNLASAPTHNEEERG